MNMVIGFGSTERSFEDAEEEAIRTYAVQRYRDTGCNYVTDDLVKDVDVWVRARADKWRAEDKSFKGATEFPDRYSSYWARTISGASDIVVILSLIHTNRRHGLSPDGWACLQTQRLVHIGSDDFRSR